MAANLGTAFLQVDGDFGLLNKRMATLGPQLSGKLGKVGKVAGLGLGAGIAAAFVGGKFLYEIGAEFDTAFDKIRVGTGKTGKHLKGLKRDFKGVVSGVPTDFESASTAIAGLNQRLGLTGKPLRKISKQMLELSRITETDVGENVKTVTRLFGDWSIKTGQQGKTLDKLFRVSQATGVGVAELSDEMVQFGSPLRQLGFNFDTAAAMFAKFEKEGVNLQTLMPGLRMALKNLANPTDELAGKLKDLGIAGKEPDEKLREVIDTIAKAKTVSGATDLASSVFGGRAWSDAAAAIQEGRFSFKALIQTMEQGKDTIRRAGKDTMDFTEHWEVFKNRVMVKLEPLASKVFGKLGDAMERVGDILTDKDLSKEEKFSKVFDMIAEAGNKAFFKVTESAARLAPKAAMTFAKGFLNAPIWSQFAVGGFLLAKFGGMGAFGKLGGKSGRVWGLGFIGALLGIELGKQIKTIIEGHKLDAPQSELFLDYIKKFFKIPDGFGAILSGQRVKIATELGTLIFNSETERVIAAKGKQLQRFVGKVPEQFMTEFQRLRRLHSVFATSLRPLPDDARTTAKRINRAFLPELDRLISQGGKKSDAFASRASGPFASLAGNVRGAMENIGGNIDAMLGKLGATKTSKFQLKKFAASLPVLPPLGRQMGGFIVPGTGSGDKFRTALPAGSFIMNREATSAFGFAKGGGLMPVALEAKERVFMPHEVQARGGPRVLESMNRAVPRLQQGGQLGKPVLTGPEGPLLDIGRSAVEKVYRGAKAYLDKHRPEAGVGGVRGPKGVGSYMGVPMANWVIEALQHAASKGAAPQPTSGYRSHAQNVSEGRTYFSEHEKTQYPGGAVDFGGYTTGLAAKMSVVNATKGFKYPLLAPIGFRDDGHASGTGHQLGGLVKVLQRLTQGGWVKTGYTTYDIDGPGAFGTLMKGMGYAELGTADPSTGAATGRGYIAQLLGKSGELPADFPLDVKIGSIGKIATLFKRDRGAGQGTSDYSIDIHRLAWNALGLGGNNKGTAFVRPADGAELGEGQQKAAEGKRRKANYESTLKKLRQRVSDAKTDPAKQSALWKLMKFWGRAGIFDKDERGHILDKVQAAASQVNPEGTIKVLSHLAGYARKQGEITGRDPDNFHVLTDAMEKAQERGRDKREKVVEKLKKRRERKAARIAGRGEFPDLLKLLAQQEGGYDLANQDAERLVALEPEDITDAYVGQEKGAWGGVLERLAGWRDTVVTSRDFATGRIPGWEAQIEKLKNLKGEAFQKNKWRIKPLREAIAHAREFIGERGTELQDLQGFGGPQGTLGSLGEATPWWLTLGGPGARVFDTQNTIRELAIKVGSTQEGEDNSERLALLEEITRNATQRLAVSERLLKTKEQFDATYPPYAGKAHSGVIVPGPPTQERTMILKGREGVFTEEQMAAMGGMVRGGDGASYGPPVIEELHIYPDGRAVMRYEGQEFETAVRKVVRSAPGTGRITPGGSRRF